MLMYTRYLLGSSLLFVTLSTSYASSMNQGSANPFEELELDPLPPLQEYVEVCGQFEQEKVKGIFGDKLSRSKYSGTLIGLTTKKPKFSKNSSGYFVIPGMNSLNLEYVIRTIRCNRSPKIVLKSFSDYLNDIENDQVRYDFATTCLHELRLLDACNPGPSDKAMNFSDIFAKDKSDAKVGKYIRVKDKFNKWYPAKILSFDSFDSVKVNFHGWADKWNAVVDLSDPAVQFYEGPKSLSKDRDWLNKHPIKDFEENTSQCDPHKTLYHKLIKEYPNPDAEFEFWDEWDNDETQ